jgi:hypothetical protein
VRLIGNAIIGLILVAASLSLIAIVISLGWQLWLLVQHPTWPSFGPPALWPLMLFGSLFWSLVAYGVGRAVWDGSIDHPRVHRRLNLEPGFSALCPRCLRDQEMQERPWYERYSRDLKRTRLQREEFDG